MSLDNNFSFEINYKRSKTIINPKTINIENPLKVFNLAGKEDLNLDYDFNNFGGKEISMPSFATQAKSNKKRNSIEHEEEIKNVSFIPKPDYNIMINLNKYPDLPSRIPKPEL